VTVAAGFFGSSGAPDSSSSPVPAGTPWTGAFVRDTLDIEVLSTTGTDAITGVVPVPLLVGIALRRNPRRAQLLVSTVLAKHVPTVPSLAIVAGELLGVLVAAELDGHGLDGHGFDGHGLDGHGLDGHGAPAGPADSAPGCPPSSPTRTARMPRPPPRSPACVATWPA
jgi:hypothetical protein